eukprot:TRINITY_DN9993_c0_g1_i1.p1 TRINITY_DN9993_c0_g1~~TRINITY_DN9993_c0_g1_i1.p1  ORF type:complete len:179 (+),score=55.22 TRINITY_DN9993_c0_g1_i1:223-759(+)
MLWCHACSRLAVSLRRAFHYTHTPAQSVDLAAGPPTKPLRGPDAIDDLLETTHHMSSDAVVNIRQEKQRLMQQLKPSVITGSQKVSTVPHHPDQLPYDQEIATSTGVWYTLSTTEGFPGKTLSRGKRWPRQGAVLVPFEVHEALKKGGYEEIKARQDLVELTSPSRADVQLEDPDDDM